MALRVDAQYPAGLLVDVRKQVVDRFARFVAQDVDAQVADRQVFDQLCEVAVIALRRLVTLIDGGQFGIFGSAFRTLERVYFDATFFVICTRRCRP